MKEADFMRGNQGIQSGGAIHWFLQRVTGICLVIVVAVHTILAHYTVPEGGLSYEWVAHRLGQPLWKLFYIFLLFLCVYHGLNGIWIIVQDYVHKDGWRVAIFGALIMLGVLMLSIGLLTIVPLGIRG
jgi:succinate dehydrogenase / fumarate reductase membrane anchor subunit